MKLALTAKALPLYQKNSLGNNGFAQYEYCLYNLTNLYFPKNPTKQ